MNIKMGYLSNLISNAVLLPADESVRFWTDRLKRFDILLLIETILIPIAALSAIGFLNSSSLSGAAWLTTPGILVTAAILPKAIKSKKIADIGFDLKQTRNSLVVLGQTCMLVFPPFLAGCWLLKSYGLDLPLRPVLPAGQHWAGWLFYQLMYIAVAEEVFFRWFLQGNILRLISTAELRQYWLQQWMSITLSALCFAAAHIITSGQIISIVTILPGLILGWLFIRTNSLLTPILFHWLANICYYLMASALT
jgi:membrane protease YdiL (CAAX protease family)